MINQLMLNCKVITPSQKNSLMIPSCLSHNQLNHSYIFMVPTHNIDLRYVSCWLPLKAIAFLSPIRQPLHAPTTQQSMKLLSFHFIYLFNGRSQNYKSMDITTLSLNKLMMSIKQRMTSCSLTTAWLSTLSNISLLSSLINFLEQKIEPLT